MSEEPINPEEPYGGEEERPEYTKVKRPFSKLTTELEPEDLAEKGVQKMILAEVARLEGEVAELKIFERDFHKLDKDCEVLKAKSKKETMLEILYTAAVAIGSALIGWLPSSSTQGGTLGVLFMGIGLFAFALLAKWKGGKA